MSIAQVRADLAALIAAATGIAEALPYPPDAIGPVPAAWLGEAVATVTMGDSEVWDWRLPLTVVTDRAGVYGAELAVMEGVLEAVMTALRADYTLGGTTFGLQVERATEGIVTVGGTPYTGITLAVRVKQKTSRSLG